MDLAAAVVEKGLVANLPRTQILYEKEITLNLFSNEVYNTNSPILLVQNMLCSELHCQKSLNLISFSYEV